MKGTETLLPKIKQGVRSVNHALVPFPLPRDSFVEAAAFFFSFLELPDETKNQFQSSVVPEDEESFVGYIKRERRRRIDAASDEAFYDQKEYFHYNRYAQKKFEQLVETHGAAVKNFFETAHKVYEHAETTAIQIIHELDVEFPGIKEKFLPEGVDPHFYLRFLRYFTSGKGEFLAKGHYDQGGYTLALAESAPGLRIGRSEADLAEIVHTDGHAVFMPGLQLHFFTSEEFAPAWHDVVQKEEHAHNEETARWAVVFFVDPVQKIRTRWEDRHTPAY